MNELITRGDRRERAKFFYRAIPRGHREGGFPSFWRSENDDRLQQQYEHNQRNKRRTQGK